MVAERNFHKIRFECVRKTPGTPLFGGNATAVARPQKNTVGGTRAERRGFGRMVSVGTRFIVIAAWRL